MHYGRDLVSHDLICVNRSKHLGLRDREGRQRDDADLRLPRTESRNLRCLALEVNKRQPCDDVVCGWGLEKFAFPVGNEVTA
jgi:hypothetical protein